VEGRELELILCDLNPIVCSAWRRAFRGLNVTIECGDLFDIEADAYVSPANSYGIMDGGLDLLLNRRFPRIGVRVRGRISARGCPLPPGEAIIVETDDPYVPFLVVAPTMFEPSRVSQTSNAQKAMSGALRAVQNLNSSGEGPIESVVFPGLGTGIGACDPKEAAEQMASAYRSYLGIE
jgi:O-acetyl-ADP-ribose deacetylase (regulator of RNase III)